MTAVAVIDPAAPVAWDQELRGAQYLLKSGLCPVALKTPEAVLFVILAGRDLGLSPVASLRSISVIQGKIECSADLQLSLFHKHGGRSKWVTLTDKEASLHLMAPWCEPHTSTFTMADAQRAGIATGNYQKYPKAMLRSRAITQGLKDIGFDATAGLYAPGEIGGEAVVASEEDEASHRSPDEPAVPEVKVAQAVTEEAGEVPTEAQNSLFARSLKSPVWTDEERDRWCGRADGATREEMAKLLDEILETGRQKKAAQIKAAS